MIDVTAAEQLLNFGARINDPQRAMEQLHGAVAIHNLLRERHVAYLADEVGMGKTYVALGALALFRHFHPDFRVLIIAPRQNIQRKWMKEMGNFIAHNVRFPDLRVKAIDDQPAREGVFCENLLGLVHAAALNPERDFFARLTSFSLPVGGQEGVDPKDAARLRDELRQYFPWLPSSIFDLRDKQGFKDNVARAICCVLPVFDLVIVDEGHNLKHGLRGNVSARNKVLSRVFGHPDGAGTAAEFRNYGLRAKRVLFLSATPVEESYKQLWNQLDVFGLGSGYEVLRRDDVDESHKKSLAARFLIRRVATIQVNGTELTKNLYRREWRRGGVATHDEPIRMTDVQERLTVALVQKKVNELLHQERFCASFQIGMLASFESFLETAKLKRDDEAIVFDDADQTEDPMEKEGIDVRDLNALAGSFRKQFNREMPHPKMDALVKRLAGAWITGEKSLVFVRRVASVKELKRKLDEAYDAWLIKRLENELPPTVRRRFDKILNHYREERLRTLSRADDGITGGNNFEIESDAGGSDTFFAWFFRGEGPPGVVSGANVQQRFTQRGTTLATFFEDNYAAQVLGCVPGEVVERLAAVVGKSVVAMKNDLREKSRFFLSQAKKPARGDRFEAVQAAAIQLLKEFEGPHQELAAVVWRERFQLSLKVPNAEIAPEIADELEEHTFFTELRLHPVLRSRLWPEPTGLGIPERFKEQELRARLLASAARLGQAFIDFYVLAINRLGSLKLRRQDKNESDEGQGGRQRIEDYLAILEAQMNEAVSVRGWRAFDELAEIAAHFDLILDVNAHDTRSRSLDEATRRFGQLLGRQQPNGGMAGQVNQTLVGQFRMPGYPFVLVTTDLLQEGEDLHTFCSSVHHYGISWTPSSMEQRTGRIDRVRSQSDRRLGKMKRDAQPEDLLQVYFPHLEDTVEVLQVRRVLERMNTFLRLMHEGLTITDQAERKIDLKREFAGEKNTVEQIRTKLKTAFPVPKELLKGSVTQLLSTPSDAESTQANFSLLRKGLPAVDIVWDDQSEKCRLFGTVKLPQRQQPFTLLLRCFNDRLLVRCISPVGQIYQAQYQQIIQASVAVSPAKIGAIPAAADRSYNLTVEDDVLLCGDGEVNAVRVANMVRRVTTEADRLEHLHLEGRDEPLTTFKKDLGNEMKYAT